MRGWIPILLVVVFVKECSTKNGEHMFPYGTDQGDRDLATENGDYLMLDLPEPLPIYTSSHSDDDGVKKLAVSALICNNHMFKDSKFIPHKDLFREWS